VRRWGGGEEDFVSDNNSSPHVPITPSPIRKSALATDGSFAGTSLVL